MRHSRDEYVRFGSSDNTKIINQQDMVKYSVGPHIRHHKIQDLKSVFFPSDFYGGIFLRLSCLKLVLCGSLTPPCASGATVGGLLTTSRRQLACLHLFSQWMA
jgi:hypothetical protein